MIFVFLFFDNKYTHKDWYIINTSDIVTIIGYQDWLQRTVGRWLLLYTGLVLTSKHVVDNTWYMYQIIIGPQTYYILNRWYDDTQDIAIVSFSDWLIQYNSNDVINILKNLIIYPDQYSTDIGEGMLVYTQSPSWQIMTWYVYWINQKIITNTLYSTAMITISIPVMPGWSWTPVWDTYKRLVGLISASQYIGSQTSFVTPIYTRLILHTSDFLY